VHRRRHRILALATAALLGLAAGCGGGGESVVSSSGTPPATSAPATTSTTPVSEYRGAVADKALPTPPLGLRDQAGRRITAESLRGRAAFVTFIYANCPDVCPLIVSNLRRVQEDLGPGARRLAVVAVSVDPRGDTRAVVREFLRRQRMAGRMHYLIGRRPELERVWSDWGIAANVDRTNPALVEHSSPVFGVTASGRLTTLYPTDFDPDDLVHDAPLLIAG
jgi:protein SCO1/2